MLVANTYNQENEEGLLTYPIRDYLDCLQIDNNRLNGHLEADERAWRQNIEEAAANTARINEQYARLQQSYAEGVQLLLNESRLIRPHFICRRLEKWGE